MISTIPTLKGHVKALYTFGETADKMIEVAKAAGITTIHKLDELKNAVPLAYENSETGDIILLSPAAASWDQFANFELRGDVFIDAVEKLKK